MFRARPFGASHNVITGPPPGSIFLSFPFCEEAERSAVWRPERQTGSIGARQLAGVGDAQVTNPQARLAVQNCGEGDLTPIRRDGRNVDRCRESFLCLAAEETC